MKERAHLIIKGMVQGVFYRAFTQEVANGHNLRGWVKNLPDGSVEAVFEGERADIEEAVKECRKGPSSSYVTGIDLSWEPYSGEFSSFYIRHY